MIMILTIISVSVAQSSSYLVIHQHIFFFQFSSVHFELIITCFSEQDTSLSKIYPPNSTLHGSGMVGEGISDKENITLVNKFYGMYTYISAIRKKNQSQMWRIRRRVQRNGCGRKKQYNQRRTGKAVWGLIGWYNWLLTQGDVELSQV